MEINFKTLVIETFDENLNGVAKGTYKFKKTVTLKTKHNTRLGDSLRTFALEKIKKGILPLSKEKNIIYARISDLKQGEISCLIKPELIQ